MSSCAGWQVIVRKKNWGFSTTYPVGGRWFKRPQQKSPTKIHCLNYTTLQSTTLHYTQLHYTTLHYTTLSTTLHYITLHYTTQLHNYTPLHSTTLHYTTLHYTTLHYTTLPSTTLIFSQSYSQSIRFNPLSDGSISPFSHDIPNRSPIDSAIQATCSLSHLLV